MLGQFIDSNHPTQLILAFMICAVGWCSIWNWKPREPFRSRHFEKVNFFLSVFIVGLFGSFVYVSAVHVWPRDLWAMAWLSWHAAALTILAIYPGKIILRICAAFPILLFTFLLVAYEFSIEELVTGVGRTIVCGSAGTDQKCTGEWGGMKIPNLIRGIYFALPLYVIIFYFGSTYLIWRERQLARGVLDVNSLNYLVIAVALSIAVIIGLFSAGADVPSLSIFSGLIAAAFALASGPFVSNLVSGLSLIWHRSVKRGDVLTFTGPNGTQVGWVENMTIWHTLIKDWDGQITLMPNSKLASSTIKNWTYGDDGKGNNRLQAADVRVDFLSDVSKARDCLVQAARKVPRVLSSPPPQAYMVSFGEFAFNLRLMFWINDPIKGIGNVTSLVNLAIADEFKREGIVIPLPQSEVRELSSAPSNTGALVKAESANLYRTRSIGEVRLNNSRNAH